MSQFHHLRDIALLPQQRFCRGCLATGSDMTHLFSEYFGEMFCLITKLQVWEGDGLPPWLCSACITLLKNLRQFQNEATSSDAAIRSYLMNITCSKRTSNNELMLNSHSKVNNGDSYSSANDMDYLLNSSQSFNHAEDIATTLNSLIERETITAYENVQNYGLRNDNIQTYTGQRNNLQNYNAQNSSLQSCAMESNSVQNYNLQRDNIHNYNSLQNYDNLQNYHTQNNNMHQYNLQNYGMHDGDLQSINLQSCIAHSMKIQHDEQRFNMEQNDIQICIRHDLEMQDCNLENINQQNCNQNDVLLNNALTSLNNNMSQINTFHNVETNKDGYPIDSISNPYFSQSNVSSHDNSNYINTKPDNTFMENDSDLYKILVNDENSNSLLLNADILLDNNILAAHSDVCMHDSVETNKLQVDKINSVASLQNFNNNSQIKDITSVECISQESISKTLDSVISMQEMTSININMLDLDNVAALDDDMMDESLSNIINPSISVQESPSNAINLNNSLQENAPKVMNSNISLLESISNANNTEIPCEDSIYNAINPIITGCENISNVINTFISVQENISNVINSNISVQENLCNVMDSNISLQENISNVVNVMDTSMSVDENVSNLMKSNMTPEYNISDQNKSLLDNKVDSLGNELSNIIEQDMLDLQKVSENTDALITNVITSQENECIALSPIHKRESKFEDKKYIDCLHEKVSKDVKRAIFMKSDVSSGGAQKNNEIELNNCLLAVQIPHKKPKDSTVCTLLVMPSDENKMSVNDADSIYASVQLIGDGRNKVEDAIKEIQRQKEKKKTNLPLLKIQLDKIIIENNNTDIKFIEKAKETICDRNISDIAQKKNRNSAKSKTAQNLSKKKENLLEGINIVKKFKEEFQEKNCSSGDEEIPLARVKKDDSFKSDSDFKPINKKVNAENNVVDNIVSVSAAPTKCPPTATNTKTTANSKHSVWTFDESKVVVVNLTSTQIENERRADAANEKFAKALYKCDDCIKCFPYRDCLNKHMERHKEAAGKFDCGICKRRFATITNLNMHTITHTTRHKCRQCGAGFVYKESAQKHLLKHEGVLGCLDCREKFKDRKEFNEHMKQHRKPQRLMSCPHCPKTYVSRSCYNIHIRRHTEELGFPCSVCSRSFPSAGARDRHATSHNDLRYFYCHKCDVTFKSQQMLNVHEQTSPNHLVASALKYACTQCNQRYSHQSLLTWHMQSVHKNTRLSCPACPATFSNANNLRHHQLRVHEKVARPRNHICDTCGSKFTNVVILKNHIRTHTGEQPFSCETCGRRFSQKAALTTHVKSVHLKIKKTNNNSVPNPSEVSSVKNKTENKS